MTSERQNVATATARGVFWTLLATVAGKVISLAALAFLARVLAPADFGMLAFALVFITYVETLGDLGLGMAFIYWPDRRCEAAQVAFIVNLVMGILWFALAQTAAPAVAAFFHSPTGEPILRALAWSFPIKALGNTHDAFLQKDLRFRIRVLPEVGMGAVKAVISVLLAVLGLGIWSLVWGQLAGLGARTALLWSTVAWRPRRSWPADLLRPMLRYGRGIVAINVLAALLHHVDLVIVGRRLGAAALGFYQMAYKIPEMSITLLIWAAGKVLFPTFARLRAAGEDPGPAYLGVLRHLSLLTLPAAVALYYLAESTVWTLFGQQWAPAAPILKALALYTALRSVGSPAGDVLKATGRPHLLAGLGVLKAIILVPVLLLAARWGAVGVATALASVTAVTMLMNLTVAGLYCRIPARATIAALKSSVLISCCVALTFEVWLRALPSVPGFPTLLIGAAIGLAAYLLAVRFIDPGAFDLMVGLLSPAGQAASSSQDGKEYLSIGSR